jgi:hypothetical protein
LFKIGFPEILAEIFNVTTKFVSEDFVFIIASCTVCLLECSLDSAAWKFALGAVDSYGTVTLQVAVSFSRLASYWLGIGDLKMTEYFHECALKTQIRLFGFVANVNLIILKA